MLYDVEALNNGSIFYYAYKCLNSIMMQGIDGLVQGNTENLNQNKNNAALFPSVIVNGSLACELMLKSLLPPKASGHDLEKLFNKLDKNTKLLIKKGTIHYIRKDNPQYDASCFDVDIHKNRELFPNWRYFHEPDKRGITASHYFIHNFAHAIYIVAKYEENISKSTNSKQKTKGCKKSP